MAAYTTNTMFTIVYRPNYFLNIPIPCYIFIKQMSLFVVWGGGSTYNFMFYMNVHLLISTVLLRLHVKHFIGLTKRESVRRMYFVITGQDYILVNTGNFNHQILPYGILFLAFIITNVFYLLSFKFSR
jgi:hypothetical protein